MKLVSVRGMKRSRTPTYCAKIGTSAIAWLMNIAWMMKMTDPIDRTGLHPDYPLPTLEWPKDRGDPPKYWWGRNPQTGALTKVYRDYGAYCD